MTTKSETRVTYKGRPLADGSVSWSLYVRKSDGTEKTIPRPEFTRPEDKPAMAALASVWRKAIAKGLSEPAAETTDKWIERWTKSRIDTVSTAKRDGQQWFKWVSTVKVRKDTTTFGALPMVDVTPDDVEAVRDALDVEIAKWEASGKVRGVGLSYSTAGNIWAIVTQAMKHASTRKGDKDFRVRLAQGNPCTDIPPPKSGEGKRRHWLRPTELLAVFSCDPTDLVTREWQETIAIAVYLHLRPNELHVLRVRDIDLEVREASITRAWDAEHECVKEPKTATGVRKVSIPETLVPLLARRIDGAKSDALLCPLVSTVPEHDRPEVFRQILKAAGIKRAELFEDTATHERLDFRSTRDTGITWRFLAGDRPEAIQREAGHRTLEQTLAYAKEVQDRAGRFGLPFPELPFAQLPKPVPPTDEPEPEPEPTTVRAPNARRLDDVPDKAKRGPAPRSPVGEPLVNRVNRTPVFPGEFVARVGFEPTTFGL